MTDMRKLKATLTEAASPGWDGHIKSPKDCLRRVLSEIETFVLPRDITLRNGSGQALSMLVKGRRLIRLNGPAPKDLGALRGLVDAELTDEAYKMTALAHLLAAFSAKATELSVEVRDPAGSPALNEVGLSTDQIRQGLHSAGYDLSVEGPDVIGALCMLAEERGLAWALFNDDRIVGSSEDIQDLETVFETALPYLVRAERPKTEKLNAWMFGHGDSAGHGPRTCVVMQGEDVVLAKVPNELTQLWIETCARDDF